MYKEKYSGALLDNRTQEEKSKDFSTKELGTPGSSSLITYLTREQALQSIKKFRNQFTTSACGAYSGELAFANLIDGFYSQAKLYRNRRNYPQEGMFLDDIGAILKKLGVATKDNTPVNEKAYNAITKEFLSLYKITGYTVDSTPTFDELARVSNELKLPQIILLYAKDSTEYAKEFPIADPTFTGYEAGEFHHFVVIPPNAFFKENGEEFYFIQDSTGKHKRRQFSRDWTARRVVGSMSIFIEEKETSTLRHKGYKFTRDLTIGSTGKDVKVLQETMQDLGFFIKNFTATEYFGGMTQKAVKDFQLANGITPVAGYFGPKTMKVLHAILAL